MDCPSGAGLSVAIFDQAGVGPRSGRESEENEK